MKGEENEKGKEDLWKKGIEQRENGEATKKVPKKKKNENFSSSIFSYLKDFL